VFFKDNGICFYYLSGLDLTNTQQYKEKL